MKTKRIRLNEVTPVDLGLHDDFLSSRPLDESTILALIDNQLLPDGQRELEV